MKYEVEMGSGAMIYIPSFMNICVDRGNTRITDSNVIAKACFYFSK
jgi:hypothetical protein